MWNSGFSLASTVSGGDAVKGLLLTTASLSSLQRVVALLMSLFREAITKGNGFEFDAHSVRDWNHWARLEYKRGEH